MDRRHQAFDDLAFLNAQIAVSRHPKRRAHHDAVAAEERFESRRDDVFQEHEAAMAVALVGQRDESVEHRRDLQDGVKLRRRVLVQLFQAQD